MKAQPHLEQSAATHPDGTAPLLRNALTGLRSLADQTAVLRRALSELSDLGDRMTRKAALRLLAHLDSFEPSVTLIGQVKSGKTSLINAMIGQPGLLPADVNPWTSVVTTIHAAPPSHGIKTGARFRFFDNDEWQRLIDSGGRIGELATRAGAEEDLERVRAQISQMREKSRRRLGRKFELLLGQEHDYETFDQDLIERYVCLGDDFGDAESAPSEQGRFADITKSADLYLSVAEMPLRLCLRDTPGVNDTFMMREQITINAIRDSRLCVVVLSAHQALTSMDMALVRLIANVKSREVVIFVNRIDELTTPSREIGEILERIIETLAVHNGPTDPQVIFGSALWANASLAGTLSTLSEDSVTALLDWAAVAARHFDSTRDPTEIIWELSGIPGLYQAIADRIADGAGHEVHQRVALGALNLARGIEGSQKVSTYDPARKARITLSRTEIEATLDTLQQTALDGFDSTIARIRSDYADRIDRATKSFLDRATTALLAHLEAKGEQTVWHYSADGLRMLLRSNYVRFGTELQRATRQSTTESRTSLLLIMARLIDGSSDQLHIDIPPDIHIPPPVSVAQTVALDLQASWWKSWWHRTRGYKTFIVRFQDLISAETARMTQTIRSDLANDICVTARSVLETFLSDQRAIIQSIAAKADASPTELDDLLGIKGQKDRHNSLQSIIDSVSRFSE
jgi:signal recognition particle receptor subunit beta